MNAQFTDIDAQALKALQQRVREAMTYKLALSAEDCALLLSALSTLALLQSQLQSKDITLHKLKTLVGMAVSSERLDLLLDKGRKEGVGEDVKGKEVLKTRERHHRQGVTRRKTVKKKPMVADMVTHELEGVERGQACPECLQGRLYPYKSATFLRITGQSPFRAEQHTMARLRCNAFGWYVTASLPEVIRLDGEPGQRYGYSARSVMALHKFYAGVPYYRQESLQGLMEASLTASTVFDQVERLSHCLLPVYEALLTACGNARHVGLDDTRHRILAQKPELRRVRHRDDVRLRCGVYSSGVVAQLFDGQVAVAFLTSLGHAGEFIDELLSRL